MLYREHNDGGIECVLSKEERKMIHTALDSFEKRTTLVNDEQKEMLRELLAVFK